MTTITWLVLWAAFSTTFAAWWFFTVGWQNIIDGVPSGTPVRTNLLLALSVFVFWLPMAVFVLVFGSLWKLAKLLGFKVPL